MAHVKVDGSWKEVIGIHAKVGGAWKAVVSAYEKTAGSWESIYELEVGDFGPAGGLIFYIDTTTSPQTYYEAAPVSTEEDKEWGPWDDNVPGAEGTAIGTGKQNTDDIVDFYGSGSTYAAQVCDGLSEGGYDDWFLPSKDELNLIYENLHLEGLGDFTEDEGYWSSSEEPGEGDEHFVWVQYFGTGSQNPTSKSPGEMRVRAVRSFQ